MKQRRLLFLLKVRPDLWSLHLSLSGPEFRAKAAAVLKEWSANGVAKATQHSDKAGNVQSLVTYFDQQWLTSVPWWYAGLSAHDPLASTKNSLESIIK